MRNKNIKKYGVFVKNPRYLLDILINKGPIRYLNNDKLCSFTYSYTVELLLKMACNGYLLLIGDGK
jgi:hypothetical protein